MASADAADQHLMAVDLAWADGPQQVTCIALRLPPGSTALAALRAGGVVAALGAATLDSLTLALWGRACTVDMVLRDGDRLELLRPLQVDPKEARRQRYRRDGVRPKRKPPRRVLA